MLWEYLLVGMVVTGAVFQMARFLMQTFSDRTPCGCGKNSCAAQAEQTQSVSV